jgi:hypothetical protein
MFSWILAKLDKHFEKMLEESMQRTADRMNKEHEAMYNQNKVPYINEIGADVPSKGSIIDEEV